MKVDPDFFLIKQRFWVLLALCLPLPLFALFWLGTRVAADIAAEQTKIHNRLRDVAGYNKIKGPGEVRRKEAEAERHRRRETRLWEKAWHSQQDMETWPAAFEARGHLLARRIQAVRGKGGEGALPAKGGPNQFLGKVTRARTDFIQVEGPGPVAKTFRPAAGVVVTLSDARGRDRRRPFIALREGDRVLVTYEQVRFFGDEMTEAERKAFCESYMTQLAGVFKELDPVTAVGRGAVLLLDGQAGRDWVYREDADGIPDLPAAATFFTYFPGPWKDGPNLYKEIWTAQEDLWIQRELFRRIRAVNRQVAAFTRKQEDGAKAAKTADAAVFVNPYWEVELKLTPDRDGLTGKVTNRLGRRQKVDGVYLLVRVQEKGAPEKIRLGGEPLPPGAARVLPLYPLDPDTRVVGILSVEQVLTWETAAIKRLDYVAIGGGRGHGVASAQSHRTFPNKLIAFPFPGDKQAGAAAPLVRKGPVLPKAPASPNGFVLERYREVSRQVRRLPVALSLIVDPQHLGLMQPAFTNGRLRWRTTQVILHRFPHHLRPQLDVLAVAPGVPPKGPPPGLPDWTRLLLKTSRPPTGKGGPAPPMRFPGTAGPAGEELPTNVEMVLYGVISLYQRYPPRGQEATNP